MANASAEVADAKFQEITVLEDDALPNAMAYVALSFPVRTQKPFQAWRVDVRRYSSSVPRVLEDEDVDSVEADETLAGCGHVAGADVMFTSGDDARGPAGLAR